MYEAFRNHLKSRRFFSAFALLLTTPIILAAMDPPAIEWEKTFEGPLWDVTQTNDGGFLVAGFMGGGLARGWDALVVKTGEQGTEMWRKTIHEGSSDHFRRALQAKDGNYVVYGLVGSTATLIKLDTKGTVVWQRRVTQVDWFHIGAMDETADGGFVIVGSGAFNNEMVRHVVRTDGSGQLLWMKRYPCLPSQFEPIPHDVDVTSDGAYFVVGDSHGPDANWQMSLLRLDGDGSVIWDRMKEDPNHLGEETITGYQTPDGGFVVTGYRRCLATPETVNCIFFYKIDADGFIDYERTFPEIGEGSAGDIAPTHAGGFVLTGPLNGQNAGWAARLDATGGLVWHTTYSPGTGRSVQQTSDGGYIVGCDAGEPLGLLIKLAPDAPVTVPFVRGRTNGGEQLALDDAICLLNYLFGRSDDPCKLSVPGCLDAADANDDGKVGITDAIIVLLHLFLGGAALPEPFAACGADPSADDLTCALFSGCP